MRRIWLMGIAAAGAAAAGLYVFAERGSLKGEALAVAGACTPVAGVAGPSDLQIDPATRLAFVTSYDREGEGVRGAVLAFAIDDFLDASSWRDRTEGAPAAFQPRGLHLYRNGETARLFVVNAAGRTVELYDVSPEGDLSHVETLTERRLTSPNDLVAVGPRAFYVSNDLEPGRDSPLGKLQFLLRAGSGRVLYFDGTSWGIAADGLRFANGVAVSADGSRFYAAETAAGALRIYERNAESGVLKEKRIVRIGAGLDNINVGEDGTLWIGAHSTTLREGGDATKPSLVIRYDEASGRTERIYANEGAEFSASTAAALHESTLLVGALDEEKFLVCRLPS